MSWFNQSTSKDPARQGVAELNSLGQWKKRLAWFIAAFAAIFLITHLTVRFYVWPKVEENKSSFEQVISQNLGVNLQIQSIQTGWDFLWPSFEIESVRLYEKGSQDSPKLTIPKVSGKLSWESLWKWQPHFHDLSFNDALIQIQRDKQGNWNIAGIPLDQSSAGYQFGNWLFEQDSLEIKNAKITWLDQKFQTNQHQINIESLTLKNSWFKHAIGLKARTPWTKDITEIKANFRHHVFGNAGNWEDWIGKIEWVAEEINLAPVSQLIEMPIQVISGSVNSQGFLYLDNGVLDGGETKTQANNLHFEWPRLGKPLKIANLETVIEQKTSGKKLSVSAPLFKWRAKDSPQDKELNGISLYWEKAPNIDSIKHAGIQAKELDIQLIEQLAKQFPLPKEINQFIENYRPSGNLKDLDANWHADTSKLPFNIQLPGFQASHYKLSFAFKEAALRPEKKGLLSFSNLSGKIFATELGGELAIDAENTAFVLPQVLEDDFLSLQEAQGSIQWVRKDRHTEYQISNMRLKHEAAKLKFDASYKTKSEKSPEALYIKGYIEEASVKNITRFFPKEMSKDARNYLNGSLKNGFIKNGFVHINGNPHHIPFSTQHPGVFELQLPIYQVQYSPAPNVEKSRGQWSDFMNVTGTVSFSGPKLKLDLKSADFESIQLSNIDGLVDDISSRQSVLKINGTALGSTVDLIQYYIKSPSGLHAQNLAKKIQVNGNAQLKINIEMPLHETSKTKLQGEVTLKNNQATISDSLEIKNINGDLLFSEENIVGRNLKADLLGGHVSIDSGNKLPWQSSSDMKVVGKAEIKNLIAALNQSNSQNIKVVQEQLAGDVAYEGKLALQSAGYRLNLDLKLNQLSSSLPAPFNKKVGATLDGQMSLQNINTAPTKSHHGQLKLGKLIDAQFILGPQDNMRLGLGINTVGVVPEKGFSSSVVLDQLDVATWQNWYKKYFPENKNIASASSAKSSGSDFDLDTLSAKIKILKLADREFKDVVVLATHDKDQWHASLQSSIATGLVQWKSARAGLPQGKLSARLQKLVIENTESGETVTRGINKQIEKIPALDVRSDELIFNGQSYGEMELLASNDQADWKIDKLLLKTPDAQVNATGKWILPKTGKQFNTGKTELNFDLDINNAGKLLTKLGFPKAIDDGSGKLVGQISWSNAPYKFDIKSLQADLSLDLIKGTILQVDPGVARLLGVLSFQGLTRIATLDIGGVLKPIVTQGTPFDRITSRGLIQNGQANIKDLNMRGPQGNIRLTGKADLIEETQDVRITVVPNFNAGSASLAYTFVNPIIGLSTMVGQYLIADEVSKLFQLDYLVQGTWASPQIIALDNKGKPLDEKQLKDIRDKSLLKQQSPSKK